MQSPLVPRTRRRWSGVSLWLTVLALVSLSATEQRGGQMPTLPLTQLDERSLPGLVDSQTLSLTFAQPVSVRELLLQIVRGSPLSIVADPTITESFIGDLKNVTVRQALNLVLPPLGLDYTVDGTLLRVFRREPETRIFDINYLASSRALSSQVGGRATSGSFARVDSASASDVFGETAKGVQMLLSSRGTFNVDRQAGLVQVTDFIDRLDRVATYLEAVHDRVLRQVQIDARVVEVELSGADARALDWTALARGGGAGAPSVAASPLSGLRIPNVARFLEALATQGKVTVLATPRILALNNEPAVVHASTLSPVSRDGDTPGEEVFTLGVTTRIGADGALTLGISPIVRISEAADGNRQTAVTATAETDTLARVADGETLVVSGPARQRETRERTTGNRGGGWFGRSTVVTKKWVEVVILLTPRIVRGPAIG